MNEVGSAAVTIIPSARGFGKALETQTGPGAVSAGNRGGRIFGTTFARTSMGPIRAGIGGIGKAFIGVAAAVGAANLFKSSITAASDLAESGSKVGVVFGQSRGIIDKFAANSAKALGLSRQAALEAAGTFGNLLVALKLPQPVAADMSTKMVKLAGDLASFNNTKPEEALEALRAGLSGEAEPLKRYGVAMNDATLRTQALKMGLISNVKDALTPAAKAQAAYGVIMDQTKTAQGDFARTSGGLANQQRILNAQFGDAKAKLGTQLLPAAVAVAGFLSGKLLPAIGAIASAIKAGFSGGGGGLTGVLGVFVKIGSGVKALVVGIQSLVGAFREGDVTSSGFNGVMERIGVAIAKVVGFIRTLLPHIQRFGMFIATVVVPAVAKFVGILLSNLQPVFASLTDVIKNDIAPALTGLWARFQSILPALKIVATVMGVVVAVILILASKILGLLLPILFQLAGFLIRTLFAAIGVVIGIIARMVLGMATVARALGTVGGAIGRFVATAIGFFRNLHSGIVSRIGDVVKTIASLPGRATAALGNLGNALLNVGKDIVRGLIRGISSLRNAVTDALLGLLPGPLKKFAGKLGISSPSKLFMYYGRMLPAGLEVGIGQGERSVVGRVGSMADRLARAGASGMAPIGYGAAGTTAALPGAAGVPSFRVFIGARELTDIVRVEIDDRDDETARTLASGRRAF